MKKYLLPLLMLLFALPAFSQYVHRNTLTGTGWKTAGGVNTSGQGTGVAISADGNVAVLCGALDSAERGAAWVYTRNGTTWTQMGKKLVPKGFTLMASVQFGYAAAISANGNTIAIGGLRDNNLKGAVWVFERQGNVWVQQGAKLVGTPSTNTSLQGESLSLSSDGNTLIFGGREDNGGIGGAWVFQRTGNIWSQQAKLMGQSPNNGWAFGMSTALTADGNTALVGANLQIIGSANNKQGFGYFFRRTGTTWNLLQMVTDSSISNSKIGEGVAISAKGNVAALGGPENNQAKGAIWIYRYNPTKLKWVKEQILVPSDAITGSRFGRLISISRGGDTLVSSGYTENNFTGAIYAFTYKNGTWSQLGSKIISPISAGTEPRFGCSVSLSGDGKILIAGRPGDTNPGTPPVVAPGAALVFYTPDILSTKKELEPELKLYPNPVSDFLHLPATASYTRLTVCDLTGKVLLTETKPTQRIDLSTFSAGIYIVSLQQKDKVQHLRIVKE